MRYLNGECWPSCDYCTRQLPSLDDAALLRIGWAIDSDGEHYCPTCRGVYVPVTREHYRKWVEAGLIYYVGAVTLRSRRCDDHLGAVTEDA